MAPYTPEEEAEIEGGVSEWEIQSRRIRGHTHTPDGGGEGKAPLASVSDTQQSPQEKKLAKHRRSYRKHRPERLEYQKDYYQRHRDEILKAKQQSYEQRKAHRTEEQPEGSEAQRGKDLPDKGQIFPPPHT